jgi:hypothetical protein
MAAGSCSEPADYQKPEGVISQKDVSERYRAVSEM